MFDSQDSLNALVIHLTYNKPTIIGRNPDLWLHDIFVFLCFFSQLISAAPTSFPILWYLGSIASYMRKHCPIIAPPIRGAQRLTS